MILVVNGKNENVVKSEKDHFSVTTLDIIFYNFATFEKSFHSPQNATWYLAQKHSTRVASQVAEQFTAYDFRKLENIKKMSKLGGDSPVPSLPSRNKTL